MHCHTLRAHEDGMGQRSGPLVPRVPALPPPRAVDPSPAAEGPEEPPTLLQALLTIRDGLVFAQTRAMGEGAGRRVGGCSGPQAASLT